MTRKFCYANSIKKNIQHREYTILEKIFDNRKDLWNALLIEEIEDLLDNPNHEFGDLLQEMILSKYPEHPFTRNGLSKEFFNNLRIYVHSKNDIYSLILNKIYTHIPSSSSEDSTYNEYCADDEYESDSDIYNELIEDFSNTLISQGVMNFTLDDFARELNRTYLAPYSQSSKIDETLEHLTE